MTSHIVYRQPWSLTSLTYYFGHLLIRLECIAMKAMILDQFGDKNSFRWDDWPTPNPASDEVRIRIHAVSVNPVDYKMRRGLLDVPLPTILGRDACGVVDAIGAGVSQFAVGDSVVAMLIGPRSNGAYAQYVTTPTNYIGKKPQGFSDAEAATLGVAGLTAFRAVTGVSSVSSSEAVLITGAAGGVGSFAVPLLRLQKAAPIITTAGSDISEQHLVENLGVNPQCVIRCTGRHVEELKQEIYRLTKGHGVSTAFDFAGGEMKKLCFESIRFDGHVVSIVEEVPSFNLDIWSVGGPLFQKSASYHLVALSARSRLGATQDSAIYRHWIDEWLSLVASGKISKPNVTTIGQLTPDNLAHAFALLESRQSKGKLVLNIEQSA